MDVKLIAITQYLAGEGGPEALIEHAGRICYRSTGHGDPAAFLCARLQQGHESIVEHASATFEITGISRACSHQLVRHRLASYSQESQRYVDMSNFKTVCPDSIAEDQRTQAVWDAYMARVRDTYKALRNLGIRKEDARFVLPNATATHIVVTMNFRELLHFFHLRISPEAQWEIRCLGVKMLKLVAPFAPTIFGEMLQQLQKQHPEYFVDEQ